MNLQIQVQIVLGYLQPVHLSDQHHLILGIDHHQPFTQILFVSYVLDACLLAMILSALANSLNTHIHVAWNTLEQSYIYICMMWPGMF